MPHGEDHLAGLDLGHTAGRKGMQISMEWQWKMQARSFPQPQREMEVGARQAGGKQAGGTEGWGVFREIRDTGNTGSWSQEKRKEKRHWLLYNGHREGQREILSPAERGKAGSNKDEYLVHC